MTRTRVAESSRLKLAIGDRLTTRRNGAVWRIETSRASMYDGRYYTLRNIRTHRTLIRTRYDLVWSINQDRRYIHDHFPRPVRLPLGV
jgi:hypothetical protein